METSYQYNDGNRVISLENKRQGTVISAWEYSYDVDGNILSKINKAGSSPVAISYQYDRLGRLTEEDYSGWKRTLYTYDAYSNRIKMMVEGRTKDELVSVTSYEYGLNNQLEKETKKQGKTTETYRYRYDDNGNETFRIWEKTSPTPDYPGNVKLSGHYQMEAPTVYEWRHYDGFNQLIRINQDEKEITYQYRGDGLRHSAQIRKLTESQGKTNLYCWDGSNIVEEQTDDGKIKTYLRGINLIASEIDSMVYYYIFNEHGDVTHLWSQNGMCKASYEYDAFGVERNPDKEDENPFRYCGEFFDLSSGTYYLRNRYYNPQNGRFMSQDCFDYMDDRDPLSLNLYTYCQNNPLRYYDPSGNSPKDILYGFITAIDDSIFLGGAQKSVEFFLGKFNKNFESDYDYFLGRVAGDIVAMASGEGASIWGILEMGGSIIGGGAVTIGSGGTLTIGGVVIVAEGVAIGAATTAAGVGIMAMAARNFGSDWDDFEGASRGRKGETFRGGSKSQRDNWYGYDNKDFQNWWHRSGKAEFGGSDIDSAKEAKQVFDYWKSIGSPKVK
jgi:RHS repeat-associated protein